MQNKVGGCMDPGDLSVAGFTQPDTCNSQGAAMAVWIKFTSTAGFAGIAFDLKIHKATRVLQSSYLYCL